MQLVQWIVPHAAGGFAVLFAPVWVEQLPAQADGPAEPIRRRSAPLTSRWLPHPIAVAETRGTPCPHGPPVAGSVMVRFTFATSEKGPPVALLRDDDLSFASLYAELVRVVADLCEAASLPVVSLGPDPRRAGLEVRFGSLVMLPALGAYDALCALRVAVEQCAQARGFLVSDAVVSVSTGKRARRTPLDGRAAPLFSSGRRRP